MALELHVLADDRMLESFRLAPGIWVLGTTAGKTLNEQVTDKLLEHPRRGDARELKHVVERAAVDTDGLGLGPDDLMLPRPGA